MKRPFLLTLALAGIVFVSLAFTRPVSRYKNLKVLPQDITEKQLDSVMHHFNNSLGVKCGFCHVRQENKEWDHASDANKHKLIAREMLEMTYAINDKYFDYTGSRRTITTQLMVTCYSCHNGKKMPETIAREKDDKDREKGKEKKEKD